MYQRICSHNTFYGHKLYFHVQNIQTLSPNSEYWELFLNYDNLITKEKLFTHPTCNRETKIGLLQATLNSKGERWDWEMHSRPTAIWIPAWPRLKVLHYSPVLLPGKNCCLWLCLQSNPSVPQEKVQDCNWVSPDKFGVQRSLSNLSLSVQIEVSLWSLSIKL